MVKILKPIEVDELLRYAAGRTRRLALQGKIPFIILPDGSMRISEVEVQKLLHSQIKNWGSNDR